MKWNDKRYHTLNYELRKEFGCKVFKLSLDGGFTCPNRDGTIGDRGCIFCSEEGSGEFAASRELNIKRQIDEQIKFLSPKWKTGKYIAYFQNFTNTYGSIEKLKKIYNEALECEGIVGIAIATRPDCLSEEVLDLLEQLNKKTYLWVEIGLQTIHENTAKLIRRGYDIYCFEKAIKNLRKIKINIVIHLIIGLPNESKEDMLESVKYIAKQDIQGVKLHLMHILKNTDLYNYYKENLFPLLEKDEYISIIADALELLPPEMVIHRVTGDGARDLLVGPKWSLHKLGVISGIDMELKARDSWQGKKDSK